MAVRDVDLEVAPGEVFAFLGPNGAGKTTTISILEGYLERDQGEVLVLGEDPAKAGRDWRGRVGFVLQECRMESLLTVRETLEMFAGYYRKPRSVPETIELVGLADKADDRAGRLSGGQQRRLDVAVALIGDAELLFLDEPTTGFDPSARRQAWQVIEGLSDLGKTVMLTTHYMDEAQELADRVAVIADGEIIAAGTPDDLGGRADAASLVSFDRPGGERDAELRGAVAGDWTAANGRLVLRTADPTRTLQRVDRLGDRAGGRARSSRGDQAEPRGRLSRADRDRERTMSAPALVLHQFRFEQKVFWRSPATVFFTVMFPVIFLLLFASLFGDQKIDGLGIDASTYYVPGIITLAVVSATLVNVAMRIVEMRESGRLKRIRGTPLPTWAYVGGRIGNAFVVSLMMVVLVTLLGNVIYGVPIPTTTIPALLVTLIVGTFSFCSIGLALSIVIPSEQAAPPITNFTVLPLYFLSGVFVPETEIPDGVLTFASIFPIRPFFEAFLTAFDPLTVGAGFDWGHLAVVAAWGIGAMLITMRYFRWSPRSDD